VQRVPVRITLDPKELAEHPLRVGLSMDAKVDVSKTDGRMLADGSRASVSAQTNVFEQNNTAADSEVRKIIAANAGAGFKATAVASAKPVAKSAAAATTASASASMATLAAGVNANAATVK
jgi:membrane fusion protein (multidrug efflux system)